MVPRHHYTQQKASGSEDWHTTTSPRLFSMNSERQVCFWPLATVNFPDTKCIQATYATAITVELHTTSREEHQIFRAKTIKWTASCRYTTLESSKLLHTATHTSLNFQRKPLVSWVQFLGTQWKQFGLISGKVEHPYFHLTPRCSAP